ncbi:MAG TPA: MaoC family dehydratase [Candidatus Binataceae bacterium]|nr:MaoC family dehydratase [Candidatus Binataceae bacterium]
MSIEASALTAKNDYYEDFNVADVYEHARGKTVEGLENVLITNLVLNTAQAHFNEHLMESAPQKHRITFGGVTASIVIGLAMEDTGEQAVEEIALDKIRFRVPVLHGDTLYAYTEVVAKEDEPADSRGHRDVGLVHFRHWGVNQRGETVFEGERKALIKKRSFSTAGLAIPREAAPAAASARPAKRAIKRARPVAKKQVAPKGKGLKTLSDKAAKKLQPARPKARRQARPKRR